LKSQAEYIKFWLEFVGVTEVQTLVVEGTSWKGHDTVEENIAHGKTAAAQLAAAF